MATAVAKGPDLVSSSDTKRPGGTVLQCYIHQAVAERSQPVRRLVAFQRVHLQAGEAQEVRLTIPAEALAYRHRDGQRRCDATSFTVWLSGDSVSGEPCQITMQA